MGPKIGRKLTETGLKEAKSFILINLDCCSFGSGIKLTDSVRQDCISDNEQVVFQPYKNNYCRPCRGEESFGVSWMLNYSFKQMWFLTNQCMKRTQENHIKDQTDGGEEEDVFVLKKKEKVKKQNKKKTKQEKLSGSETSSQL